MTTGSESGVESGAGRGRARRWLWIGLGVVAVGLVGLWWGNPLRGIPDVGDPFDVAGFVRAEVPDDGNAFVMYREADRQFNAKDAPPRGLRWEKAGDLQRGWLEANRPALESFLEGSKREGALYHRVETARWTTLLNVTQSLRGLSAAALLEASRREDEGDMAGAWECYRAVLRASEHSGRRGCEIERLVGMAMMREALEPIEGWAADPRVDAGLLGRALEDARAASELAPPSSETLRAQYLLWVQSLSDPELPKMLREMTAQKSQPVRIGPFTFDWDSMRKSGSSLRLRGEPEKSIRLLRMVYANQLAYCDLPEDRRPKLLRKEPLVIYEPASEAPAEVKAIAEPGRMEEFEGSLVGSLLDENGFGGVITPAELLGGRTPADAHRQEQERVIRFLEKELRRRTGESAPPGT